MLPDGSCSEPIAGWVEVCLTSEVEDLWAALAAAAPDLREPVSFLRRVVVTDRLGGVPRLRLWLGSSKEGLACDFAATVANALSPIQSVSVEVTRCAGPGVEAPFDGPEASAFTVTAMDAMVTPLFDARHLVETKRATPFAVAVQAMSAHLLVANTRAFEFDSKAGPRLEAQTGTAVRLPATAPWAHASPNVSQMPATFLSFRSHAEGFFVMARDPVSARAQFARRYEEVRPAVTETIARALGESAQDGDGYAGRLWAEYVRTVRPVVEGLVASGGLCLPSGNGAYLGDRNDLRASRFHQIMQDSPNFRSLAGTNDRFLTGRILTSMLYLFLHCLGLPLAERFFACYAVSRACEELSGSNAEELLGRLARRSEKSVTSGRAASVVP